MPELEIHHINVGQGDATLIINRNIDKLGKRIDAAIEKKPGLGRKPDDPAELLPFATNRKIDLAGTIRKAVLIDAGEQMFGDVVSNYLKDQGLESGKKLDDFFTVATHFHTDHVGGFQNVFFTDNDDDGVQINFAPAVAYDCGDLAKWDKPNTRKNYLRHVKDLGRACGTERGSMAPRAEINLEADASDTPIRLVCLASNCQILAPEPERIRPAFQALASGPDQNARSVVFVLEYGEFRYFLGADIYGLSNADGGNIGINEAEESGKHEMESAIRSALPIAFGAEDPTPAGHVCCFTANHHGSSYSNDVYLLEAMSPTIAICSAGVRKKFHHHPTRSYLNKVDGSRNAEDGWRKPDGANGAAAKKTVVAGGSYVTEIRSGGKRYGRPGRKRVYEPDMRELRIMGDIVVRPTSKPKPDAGQGIDIQVYGTGRLTPDKPGKSDDLMPVTAGGIDPFNVGPFIHKCDKH